MQVYYSLGCKLNQALLFELNTPTANTTQKTGNKQCNRKKYKQKGILQKDKQTKARKMAERTGLEPATTGVTGRYSNQLNYRSVLNISLSITHSARH